MALYRGQLSKPKVDRETSRKYTHNHDAEDFWQFVKQELNIG